MDERLKKLLEAQSVATAERNAAEARRLEEQQAQEQKAQDAITYWQEASDLLAFEIHDLNGDLATAQLELGIVDSMRKADVALAAFTIMLWAKARPNIKRLCEVNVSKYGHIQLRMGSKTTMPAHQDSANLPITRERWRELLIKFLEIATPL